MSNKTRKIIATLSIIFIIGLYAYKGLSNLAGKSIGDTLPMIVTSLAVTGIKVGIIYGIIILNKKIINKENNTKKEVNESNFEKQKEAAKIVEREKK